MARRDEKGLAEVREIVERERQVPALLDEPPKDGTISWDEAERFLVELYRTGIKLNHVAERTNCSPDYAMAVRRRAPELVSRNGVRRTRVRTVEQAKGMRPRTPLLDIRALRDSWGAEQRLRGRQRQDSRMLAACLAGDSLFDIPRRENIHRDVVW